MFYRIIFINFCILSSFQCKVSSLYNSEEKTEVKSLFSSLFNSMLQSEFLVFSQKHNTKTQNEPQFARFRSGVKTLDHHSQLTATSKMSRTQSKHKKNKSSSIMYAESAFEPTFEPTTEPSAEFLPPPPPLKGFPPTKRSPPSSPQQPTKGSPPPLKKRPTLPKGGMKSQPADKNSQTVMKF
jgi:hypothetical protein